jgi:hypothetical protein
MYEFVKTETGWRVFWGIDPIEPRTVPGEVVFPKEQASVALPQERSAQPLPTPATIA